MSEGTPRPHSRLRRWLIVSSLLLLFMFAWTVIWPIYRKYEACQILEAAGAFIDCDYHKEYLAIGPRNDWTERRRQWDLKIGWPLFGVVRRIHLVTVDNDQIRAVRRFPRLIEFGWNPDVGMSADELLQLGSPHELKRLHGEMRPSNHDDDILRMLSICRQLQYIGLYGAEFTDDGIAYLEDHESLQHVWVTGEGITDASFSVFSSMPELSILWLHGDVSITEDGVRDYLRDNPIPFFNCRQHLKYSRNFGKYTFAEGHTSDVLHAPTPDRRK